MRPASLPEYLIPAMLGMKGRSWMREGCRLGALLAISLHGTPVARYPSSIDRLSRMATDCASCTVEVEPCAVLFAECAGAVFDCGDHEAPAPYKGRVFAEGPGGTQPRLPVQWRGREQFNVSHGSDGDRLTICRRGYGGSHVSYR